MSTDIHVKFSQVSKEKCPSLQIQMSFLDPE